MDIAAAVAAHALAIQVQAALDAGDVPRARKLAREGERLMLEAMASAVVESAVDRHLFEVFALTAVAFARARDGGAAAALSLLGPVRALAVAASMRRAA